MRSWKCVLGEGPKERKRGLYRLLALNTEGNEKAKSMRNLKAYQASSGTAGRRVSDFISSLSRLALKITVIKKAAKYSGEREGILSPPHLPSPFTVAGCFLPDLSAPLDASRRALCGTGGMVITASLADVVLISRERCCGKMRVPTQWTRANRKVIPARAMTRPLSPLAPPLPRSPYPFIKRQL